MDCSPSLFNAWQYFFVIVLQEYPAGEHSNLVSEKLEDYKAVEDMVKHMQESDEQADNRHRRQIKVVDIYILLSNNPGTIQIKGFRYNK